MSDHRRIAAEYNKSGMPNIMVGKPNEFMIAHRMIADEYIMLGMPDNMNLD